jgi:hypothetical protein
MINGAQVPLFAPHATRTHAQKKQKLPPSPSPLAAERTMGAAEARASTDDGSDRTVDELGGSGSPMSP